MQKSLIQYQTLYGSAEQYVRWIQESCAVDVRPVERKQVPDFGSYDTIGIDGLCRERIDVIVAFLRGA